MNQHTLHHLPTITASAAENMAHDLLLLEHYPTPDTLRFRHYHWATPCHTFGYTQQWQFIQTQTNDPSTRRPTAGGLVSHHHDWTWTLVIPPQHPWCREKAALVYQHLHQAIAEELNTHHVPAALIPCPRQNCGEANTPTQAPPPPAPTGICFQSPEIYDVARKADGTKIAGAAQKRNRHGLLVQGSIDRTAAHEVTDWQQFETNLIRRLATALQATPKSTAFPKWDTPQWDTTCRKFQSHQWNQRR